MFNRISNLFIKNKPEILLHAARDNNLDGIRSYLEKYANEINAVNATDGCGQSALYFASQAGHERVVEALLRSGANVNQATTKDGGTPLFIAAENGHLEVIKILIDNGADVNQATTNDGIAPLCIAAQNGHLEVAQLLLDKGADVNQATTNGATPLFIAAQNGHLEVAQLLIDKGANVNQAWTNNKGKKITPLQIADEKGHYEIASLIRSKLFPSFDERLNRIGFTEDIPHAYLCPVSQTIMNDPVTISSGHTYNRESIISWAKESKKPDFFNCPLTSSRINKSQLSNKTTMVIKSMIEDFVKAKEQANEDAIKQVEILKLTSTSEKMEVRKNQPANSSNSASSSTSVILATTGTAPDNAETTEQLNALPLPPCEEPTAAPTYEEAGGTAIRLTSR